MTIPVIKRTEAIGLLRKWGRLPPQGSYPKVSNDTMEKMLMDETHKKYCVRYDKEYAALVRLIRNNMRK